jgi:2-C-methyl-D-erythritol 4-phosphate cytidylyltransferase
MRSLFRGKVTNCDMRHYAVIVAGGSGSRMKSDRPKQFMELLGRPILVHTVGAFLVALERPVVVLVLPESHLEEGRVLMSTHFPDADIRFVVGGEQRFHSVQRGLAEVDGPGIVHVHDAVRCLVTPSLIRKCDSHARERGSAIPAVPVRDSMRMLGDEGALPVDRGILRAIQTPQTFRSEWIKEAYAQPYQPAFTDEATVAECKGFSIELVEGEETNIKVTFPLDLVVAEKILASRLSGT